MKAKGDSTILYHALSVELEDVAVLLRPCLLK
jgi:hypothetical protein